MFKIEDFFEFKNYDDEKRHYFGDFEIVDVCYRKAKDELLLKISNNTVLPFRIREDLIDYFKSQGFENTRLIFKVVNETISLRDLTSYLKLFSEKNSGFFADANPQIDEKGITLLYPDRETLVRDFNFIDELKLFFYDIGLRQEIQLNIIPEKTHEPETVEIEVKTAPKPKPVQENPKRPEGFIRQNNYKPKSRTYADVKIDDLIDTLSNVKFFGQIFKVDERVTRTNMVIQSLYVKDESNAVLVKCVEGRRFTKEVLAENKEGKYANFYGSYRFDNYLNDYLFEPDQIEFVDYDDSLKDPCEEKRIELHAHTNKSEMDAVCEPEEIVKAAFKMGHEGVAITDHLDVQGFPRAQRMAESLLKSNPDRKFKVLYGCEFNVVNSKLNLVYNPTDQTLKDAEYVVFDLETTGLSSRHDYAIEFGAVLLHRGIVKERRDFFLKPPIQLSTTIKNLTHISDSDVANARTFEEAKDELLEFIKGRVLVAHNASFDYGFLNEELKRLGLGKLTNPVIDTLDLSRCLFKSRRSFRLGNIARQYGVSYDENVAHRADYDAEVLAQVFHLMLKDLDKLNITTIQELHDYEVPDAFIKNRAFHAIALCKNKEGIRDLFRLVSISNTDTLAVFGKANTKSADSEFIAEPRILKETLEKYRKNLLIGSACLNGEVFEMASTRSKEELARAISFFDYIEIQPLDNYRSLVYDRESFDEERLKTYLRDIIEEAQRQNKIIVATGDLHYVTKDEKLLRDVYINSQAIGGMHHPLYIYDKEKRAKQITPDQRFFNTQEMLDRFAWLNDEQLVKDLVINNTHKIADICDNLKPMRNKLYTPVVEGSTEKLRKIVYDTAHARYGEVLDPKIEARITRELNSIFGNGYGVIYYVSHLLVKKSNDDGYLVGSRGSVGSSLVATFSGITECNPLSPHYICHKCFHLEWHDEVASGFDLPDKRCPVCGELMEPQGQNIPFETFLGFYGDKVPDIDLNFSGDYQPQAHLFTREVFGSDNVFRAGTISTVAEKTAFGYASGYCEEKGIANMSRAQKQRIASGCEGVKRTTGQHPGGIIVIPNYMDVYDITPVQYPANDSSAEWRTTHFDFHEIHDNVLKFDILGHVDPTAMKLLENVSGMDVRTIPMNDPKTMSIFSSPKELGIINPNYDEETGACGLPEYGTRFVRGILAETKPQHFSDLVIISGLSHGTDVWNNNAKDLVDSGQCTLSEVIGCRDDIMIGLIGYGLPKKESFDIMEKVRKGKGLSEAHEGLMREHNVPEWYIDSCKKIKYMFPKAHAVAYVIMAVRVAWFKVHHPEYYYVSFFSLRCDAYEIQTMIKDWDGIKRRMDEIEEMMNSKENPASKKDKDIYNMLEVCYEMVSRGYRMSNIDLNLSLATEFRVHPEDHHIIIPPFKILDGLGDNVAVSIVEARNDREFLSKEDLMDRTQLSQTLMKKLDELGVLKGLDDSNQMSLF